MGGRNNRVYNNTVYHSGYGYTGSGYPATRRHGMAYDVYDANHTGNVVKNNIIYESRDGDFGGSAGRYCSPDCTFQGKITTVNNWCSKKADGCTGTGYLKFTNPDITDPTSQNLFPDEAGYFATALPELTLKSNSLAINAGIYLTVAVGAETSSTTLVVADALYFQDGTWGSDLTRTAGKMHADWIAIGTVGDVVKIHSINYTTNTITLASAKTWSNGAKIWLYKKSDGTQVSMILPLIWEPVSMEILLSVCLNRPSLIGIMISLKKTMGCLYKLIKCSNILEIY